MSTTTRRAPPGSISVSSNDHAKRPANAPCNLRSPAFPDLTTARIIVITDGLRTHRLPKDLLQHPCRTYDYWLGGVRLVTVACISMPVDGLPTAMRLLSDALRPRGWYVHAVTADALHVAFPDGVRTIVGDQPQACEDMRAIGRRFGIPDRQMPFERLHVADHPHGHAGDAVNDRRHLFTPTPAPPGAQAGVWCGRVLTVHELQDGSADLTVLHAGCSSHLSIPVGPYPEVGDLIGCAWTAGTDHPLVTRWTVLTATIAAWPALAMHGRKKDREVELLRDAALRRAILDRAAILRSLRAQLDNQGYIECETPTLLAQRDIAPVDHLQAVGRAVSGAPWLRICPENHLKRLVVAGFDRVYELGRNWRDDAPSDRHQPEFTSVEIYAAWSTWEDMAHLVATLTVEAVRAATGGTTVRIGDRDVDLAGPWRRIAFRDACQAWLGIDPDDHPDAADLARAMRDAGIPAEPSGPRRVLLNRLGDAIEPHLQQPTLLMRHPTETICVARRSTDHPGCLERFEAYVGGIELAHAFSELDDAIEQRERMQALADERGGADLDEVFLRALQIGLPPTGGLGIGVDRLVMLATGQPIHRTIAFPHRKDLP